MVTGLSLAGELLEVWSFPVQFFGMSRGLGLELFSLSRCEHCVVQMFAEASESNRCLHFHALSDPEMDFLRQHVA